MPGRPVCSTSLSSGRLARESLMSSIVINVGIDVSKDTLAVYIDREAGQKRMNVTNDSPGINEIVEQLRDGRYRVAMEATGRHETAVRRALEAAGVEVIVENPRLARHLALGLGWEAKTDPIDAEALAMTASVCKRTVPRSPEREALGDLNRAIHTLTRECSGYKKRLQCPGLQAGVAESYKRLIADFDTEIAKIERLFAREVRQGALSERYRLCLTVPGVGPALARVLVCELPEDLSGWSVDQICSYGGVTPVDRASGKSVGKSRLTRHGNMFIKGALYMPALSLMRVDPEAKETYAKRLAQGKTHQQAKLPIMHRILRRVAAVIKRGSPWQDDPPKRP
jgi:transposase